MEIVLSRILSEIRNQEDKLSSKMMRTVDEAYQMTLFLNEMLGTIKAKVIRDSFANEHQEIDFFKNIKPQVLGKLIYYNKVFRIETTCPVSNGRIHQSYFENQLKILKSEYKESISIEDFYRYYRTGRTDRDHCYFRLGQINPDENPDTILTNGDTSKDISWTNSQNALIELIYAIYASCSVSHGKIGIRKLALIFQVLLRTPLNDIHHSFHRMKTRAGSRTAFLDQLKTSLEEYMDKDL